MLLTDQIENKKQIKQHNYNTIALIQFIQMKKMLTTKPNDHRK